MVQIDPLCLIFLLVGSFQNFPCGRTQLGFTPPHGSVVPQVLQGDTERGVWGLCLHWEPLLHLLVLETVPL